MGNIVLYPLLVSVDSHTVPLFQVPVDHSRDLVVHRLLHRMQQDFSERLKVPLIKYVREGLEPDICFLLVPYDDLRKYQLVL